VALFGPRWAAENISILEAVKRFGAAALLWVVRYRRTMAVKRKRFNVTVEGLSRILALVIQAVTLLELLLKLAHHN
jgi:hypothetical protein